MGSFYDWQYAFPQLGYLILVAIPILYLLWALFRYRQRILKTLFNSANIEELSSARSPTSSWIKIVALCFVWIFACLALMEPRGDFRYPVGIAEQNKITVIKQNPQDILFLIDSSASMTATDTRDGKSRLATAKDIADEIIALLQGQNGAIYAFTGEATSLSPPTLDYLFLRLVLKQLDVNEGGISGTDFASALRKLQQNFWTNPAANKTTTLVILSDGEDTILENLKDEARSKARENILSTIKNSATSHLRVYTIGIGSSEGAQVPNMNFQGKPVISRLHDDLLKDLSQIGRGSYYSATSLSSLEIARNISEKLRENAIYDQQTATETVMPASREKEAMYDLFFQIPLALAIGLLLVILFFPDTAFKRTLVLLLIAICPINAVENPGTKAIALYEIKDYAKAMEIYQEILIKPIPPWEKNLVLYNVGTLLLAEKRWKEAQHIFEQISIGTDPSPFFVRYVKTNLAVAYLRESYDLSNTLEYDHDKIKHLANKSIQYLQEAAQAECSLEHLYESKNQPCTIPSDIKEMLSIATQLVVKTNEADRQRLLNELKNLEPVKTSEQRLQQLLIRYQLQMDELTLDIAAITTLQKDQTEWFPEAASNSLLEQSIKALKDNREPEARFYFHAAYNALNDLVIKEEKSPESVLSHLLSKEKQALTMNNLFMQIPGKNEAAIKMILDSQQPPLKQAGDFIDVSLDTQKSAFEDSYKCQWAPWNEVFPLFDQGYIQGNLAIDALSKGHHTIALEHQEESVKKWEEALEKLKQGKNQDKEPPAVPQSVQNTFNLVQEMQLNDIIPQPKGQPMQKEGELPW